MAPWLLDPEPYLLGAGCVFLRLIGVLIATPFWRGSPVPLRLRVLMVMYLVVVFVWALRMPAVVVTGSALGWLSVLAPELVLGLALGMLVRVVLAAAEGMGRIVGLSIGLGFANFVDPTTGDMQIGTSSLLAIFVMLLFVGLDVHLDLLAAMLDTFQIQPVGETTLMATARGGRAVAELGSVTFELSLRLAAPVLAGSLMIFTVLAVVSRVAPQMNLFAFGFIVTIPAGLLILMAQSPQFVNLFADEFGRLPGWLREFMASRP